MTARVYSVQKMKQFRPWVLTGHRNAIVNSFFQHNSLNVSFLNITVFQKSIGSHAYGSDLFSLNDFRRKGFFTTSLNFKHLLVYLVQCTLFSSKNFALCIFLTQYIFKKDAPKMFGFRKHFGLIFSKNL